MTFTGIVSIISLLWFVGGALWLLIAPAGFVRFASLKTRQDLTPAQLRWARILGCVGLIVGAVIVFEFKYGLIR
jgi:multisubunit Na+/H+ antiporter MnhG subunit